MNWIRQNRFFSAFLAVVVLGTLGLGFLLYTSLSRYQQVDADYKTQVAELKRLQDLEPYPDAASQKKYEDVRQKYMVAVTALQNDLAAHEPAPVNPPPTPIQFQDRLRQVVNDVSTLAQNSGVGLPEGFYLGFEQYRGSPPDAAATPMLNAQLNAIQDLVTILIKTRIEKLTSIKRALLPQEGGATGASTPPPRPGFPPVPGAAAPGGNLVSKQTVELSFTTLPSSFRESLNNITRDSRLYIVRALQVKNQQDKGPPRAVAMEVQGGTDPAAAATPAPTAPEPGGVPNPPLPDKNGGPLRYVVGLERLDVTARIEIARVLPPAGAPPR